MIVTLVPHEALPKVWAEVAPLIAKVVTRPEVFSTTVLDVYDWCLKGKFHLWIMVDEDTKKIKAAGITIITVHPGYRALLVLFGSGSDVELWLDKWMQILKKFAAECDCAVLEICGREGWIRKLKKETNDQWCRSGVMIHLELDEPVAMAAE